MRITKPVVKEYGRINILERVMRIMDRPTRSEWVVVGVPFVDDWNDEEEA